MLKAAVQDCLEYIKFDEEARKAFKSEFVCNLLTEMMSATLKALELISQYYSRRRISASFLVCIRLELTTNKDDSSIFWRDNRSRIALQSSTGPSDNSKTHCP